MSEICKTCTEIIRKHTQIRGGTVNPVYTDKEK